MKESIEVVRSLQLRHGDLELHLSDYSVARVSPRAYTFLQHDECGAGRGIGQRELLRPLACSLGIDPMWITCDPENVASRRSLEIARADFMEIVDVPEDCGIRKYGGKTRKCRYRL